MPVIQTAEWGRPPPSLPLKWGRDRSEMGLGRWRAPMHYSPPGARRLVLVSANGQVGWMSGDCLIGTRVALPESAPVQRQPRRHLVQQPNAASCRGANTARGSGVVRMRVGIWQTVAEVRCRTAKAMGCRVRRSVGGGRDGRLAHANRGTQYLGLAPPDMCSSS